ncbi:MAG: nuclear transport factor 2 family protein [Thaumarchaeota archaeon]|nr:nuclear transport factor 2 family protein [Nitrososphaerota archaeon]
MESGHNEQSERREVEAFIVSFFEAGKEKDLTTLMDFHSPSGFSKFDDNPPFTRQNSEDAFVHEQAAFANISDYQYELADLKVELIGGVAIATFYLTYKGVFVNDYSFEGSTVGSKSRVTMVLARYRGQWRMVHEHFSSFPELPRGERAPSR